MNFLSLKEGGIARERLDFVFQGRFEAGIPIVFPVGNLETKEY